MASHKSALKRIQQTRKRTALNRMHRTRLRHQISELRAALNAKDKPTADALLRPTLRLIDYSIHRGIIHPNTAARYKSRLAQRYKGLA